MRVLRWVAGIIAALGVAAYVLILWPLRDPHPRETLPSGTLAIVGAGVYVSPDARRLEHATVIVRDGRIVSVRDSGDVPVGARVIECETCTLTAGFFNAHVHFTEQKWSRAWFSPTSTLDRQLTDLSNSRGFTTLVDLGSDPRMTLSLRRRIAYGWLAGPTIYTAGRGFYPPHGIPYYLRNSVPWYLQRFMPQPETPEEAARIAERNWRMGTDVLKLFTGSYVERGQVLHMPEPIAAAAAEVAHRHGQVVFAHPSDLAGTRVAMDAGVDVLAHAPDSPAGIDSAFLQQIVDHHMAMIPTLMMFATTVTPNDSYMAPIRAEVARFHQLGGQLIFGTDVGYMTDYDTREEFVQLARAGLGWRDILAMLTTAPASRLGLAHDVGTVTPGMIADLTLLDADPADSVAAFAHVRATIGRGWVLFQKPSLPDSAGGEAP